jgi:hypothetical protein
MKRSQIRELKIASSLGATIIDPYGKRTLTPRTPGRPDALDF